MADIEHLSKLLEGAESWNAWRNANKNIKPNLSDADLKGVNLSIPHFVPDPDPLKALFDTRPKGANLTGADFYGTNLSGANLQKANFAGAILWKADLSQADLREANLSHLNIEEVNLKGSNLSFACLNGSSLPFSDLSGAELVRADLITTNLANAKLRGAHLNGANLTGALLIETDLENADLSGCIIYGISVWNTNLNNTKQSDLVITRYDEPAITVDDLEVAQFTYLLLNNEKIRNVIDTIGKKGVLILGRFTPEQKVVLDAIRNNLRTQGFVPMMFDFEKPTQRDFTETIKTLAGLSRFIIADITNPKSSPLELQATMPDYMIPFVPIIQENEEPFAMFRDLKQKYGEWVLDVLKYDSVENLMKVMEKAIIQPALEMGQKLLIKKAEDIRSRHVADYF